MQTLIWFLLALGLLTFLTACNGSNSNEQLPPTELQVTPTRNPLIPVQIATRLASLFTGKFQLDDGCLLVVHGDSMTATTLVVATDQSEIVVEEDKASVTDLAINPNTAYEWISGAQISLAGGGIDDPNLVPHHPIPDHCPENYFLVGWAH